MFYFDTFFLDKQNNMFTFRVILTLVCFLSILIDNKISFYKFIKSKTYT